MIAKVMEDAIRRKRGENPNGENCNEKETEVRKIGDLCPQCGGLAVVREGNCMTCEKCGFTTC
jgi:predicted RNA-binding Zn-ribbon protein involved in translation (DUF1610 family)